LNLQDGAVANRIFLDLDPLRESDFRLLFAGQLVGVLGRQLATVAISFQVYLLTHSSLQVGAVSLAQLLPLILGTLVGGVLGDVVDRRRLLMVSSLLLVLTTGGLAVNAAMAHPSLVAIYLVSAVAAGCGGVASTTANAVVPSLVGPDQLLAAYATMQVVDQAAMVAAPVLAGVLIGAVHLPWVFAAGALTYVVAALTVVAIAPMARSADAARLGLPSVMEGLRFVRGRQNLQGAFLVDINAMVFGTPRALFPALALSVYHGGPRTLGYLYAAPAAGALVGALVTGWLARLRRMGIAVVAAVCVWGASIVIFGLVHRLWLALVLLAVAGWADVISAVLRTTIVQRAVPEAFRSRLSGLQMAVVEGGPRLGDLESGVVAGLVSTEFAIVSGGLACIAGAIALAGLLPGFRDDRAR
jgi:MFS family permease